MRLQSTKKLVAGILDGLGYKYSFQHYFIIRGKIYFSDFYFADHHLTLEIDGFHHLRDPQKSKDIKKTKALKKMGVETIRFRNDEIDKDQYLFIATIKSLLS